MATRLTFNEDDRRLYAIFYGKELDESRYNTNSKIYELRRKLSYYVVRSYICRLIDIEARKSDKYKDIKLETYDNYDKKNNHKYKYYSLDCFFATLDISKKSDSSYQLFVSNYHDDKKALLLLEIIKIMIENKVIELENDNDISYINNAMNKIKNGEHASTGEIKIKINLDEVELYSGNEEFCYKKIKSNILKRNVKRHLITISILLSMFVLIGLIISFPYTFIAICIILALLTGLVYLYRFIFKLVKRKIG